MADTLGWKAKYATDITSLDAEHKELLELVGTLISSLESPNESTDAHAHVVDSYNKVREHIIKHFHGEEQIMRNIGFPEIGEHIAQHKELLEELDQFEKMITGGSSPENWEPLASMLNVWVLRHIMSSDIKIGKFIHRDPS